MGQLDALDRLKVKLSSLHQGEQKLSSSIRWESTVLSNMTHLVIICQESIGTSGVTHIELKAFCYLSALP